LNAVCNIPIFQKLNFEHFRKLYVPKFDFLIDGNGLGSV